MFLTAEDTEYTEEERQTYKQTGRRCLRIQSLGSVTGGQLSPKQLARGVKSFPNFSAKPLVLDTQSCRQLI
jgi:hypothetical protein